MSFDGDDHKRLLRDAPGGKDREHVLAPGAILEVHQIPPGENGAGDYTLTARGKNTHGELTVVELRVFPNFIDAVACWLAIRNGWIAAEDVPAFDPTNRLREMAREHLRSLRTS